MDTSKKAVLMTGALALLFLGGGALYKALRPPEPIVFNTFGHPEIGTGPVELVLFEDFCCTHCRIFTEQVFPQITEEYVSTGRARLAVVLVAFGENSKILANAALTVYKIAQDKFIAFILALSHSMASGRNEILRVAEKLGGINLDQLAYGIDHRLYYVDIDRNLIWAHSLMGDNFGTPTLFVNGIEIATDSLDALAHHVEQLERQE